MHEVQQLIDGQWGTAGDTRYLTVLSPFDGTPVTRLPIASEQDVALAVRAARSAAPGWGRTAAGARAAALRSAADALAAAAKELAQVMSAEMGKPVDGACDSIAAGVDTLRQ